MLNLKNITKDYPTGNETVHALRGVSLSFRKSEFVSILGQSGCGKTTLLNIIGGLDRYTSGDLVINGRSTKKYTERDWDTYRNHSVGFVFQSYNLIPHQTVLQNVELALTLSGVSKHERRIRAKEALSAVGLSSQLNKRPSEMSGGQMQRVAIARAIVNNPDIILADEPTGALDSETSVQVMEILKEISKERLVVMVTHNPELAEQYSTRTVKMLDGVIVSDSDPLTGAELSFETEKITENNKAKRVKKPSMSFFTSFSLSLRNLFTKKGRTILTSFAGSIGIIGIALISAVSSGMKSYISNVQEETLSSYPITLEAQHINIGTLMETFIGAAQNKNEHKNDAVYQKPVLYDLVNTLSQIEAKQNDLKSFKNYLETSLKNEENSKFNSAINGIQYSYNMNLQIFTKNENGIIKSDTEKLIQQMLIKYMGQISGSGAENSADTGMLSMLTAPGASSMITLWQEILPDKDGSTVNPLIKKQYDLIYGNWPTEYNQILVIVDENNEIDDMTLYSLGLISDKEIDDIVNAAAAGTELPYEQKKWSYEEICNMEFRTILNGNCFGKNNQGLYVDRTENKNDLAWLYNNEDAIDLEVTGIIKLKEDAMSTMFSGTLAYTHLLTQHVIEMNKTSEPIVAQLNTPNIDIFTGLPFKDTDGSIDNETKATTFDRLISEYTVQEKAALYIKIKSIPDPNWLEEQVNLQLAPLTEDMNVMRDMIVNMILQQTGSVGEQQIRDYINTMDDNDLIVLVKESLSESITSSYAAQVKLNFAEYTDEQIAEMFNNESASYTNEIKADYYDTVLEFSNSTYELNMTKLGYVNLDEPSEINLYANSFKEKDVIEEMIIKYNKGVDEVSQIEYTDFMGIMMSSITTIIDAISYVLGAFVSVSLIVSSIMIGVITLISVQERTKEIGILRAIGASKRNVCRMFNAETLIIGFVSGVIGVGVTYILCIPINLILNALTGISSLKAFLDPVVAIILIIISLLLTLISGLIPSRSAAKKDPVVALRTE